MKFINQAIKTYNEIGSRQGVAKSLIIRARIRLMLSDRDGAKDDLKRSFEYALLMDSKKLKLENLMLQSSIYKEENDSREAYDLYEMANAVKDSIFNEERSRHIDEYSILYETQKKEKEIVLQKADIERKNADLRQQKILSQALTGGIVVLAIFAGLIVFAYIQKRKINLKILQQKQEIEGKNRQLDLRNEEIETQRDLLFKQNQEITENIEYAKRIQTALLPSNEILDKHLKEHFVLYLPKNIVSGDFYWVKTVEQYTLVVVADCTGHAVSGAFMSILGISLLNEVVKEGVIDPAMLLKRLRTSIKTTLRQTNNPYDTRDGMDMALCIIDRNKKKLYYSGAFIPLIVIKGNEIFEYSPDKMPIGIFPVEKEAFTNHTIDLDGTECIYMFSDGFYDQFGGANFKKFKRENLQLALLENHKLPMDEQREILTQRFEDWKGEIHQFDDVLVMGFRVAGLI